MIPTERSMHVGGVDLTCTLSKLETIEQTSGGDLGDRLATEWMGSTILLRIRLQALHIFCLGRGH